jgi:hypothetical protein
MQRILTTLQTLPARLPVLFYASALPCRKPADQKDNKNRRKITSAYRATLHPKIGISGKNSDTPPKLHPLPI